MSDRMDLLAHRDRPAASDPEGVLILFHGRGADEHDLWPLFDMLDPEGRLYGIAPRGPLSLPPGGAHWYVVERVGYPDPDTFWPTFQRAQEWLTVVSERTGVGPERTILAGFSQGAVMTHALGLALGRPSPAAMLTLSGFIPNVDGLDLALDDRNDLHVAIGHGTLDPVIRVEFGREARDRLEAAGAHVHYRESPIGHTIDPGYLMELRTWLGDNIDRVSA